MNMFQKCLDLIDVNNPTKCFYNKFANFSLFCVIKTLCLRMTEVEQPAPILEHARAFKKTGVYNPIDPPKHVWTCDLNSSQK